jgi:hypothetical protein
MRLFRHTRIASIVVFAATTAARVRLDRVRLTQSLLFTTTHPTHRWTDQHNQAKKEMERKTEHGKSLGVKS